MPSSFLIFQVIDVPAPVTRFYAAAALLFKREATTPSSLNTGKAQIVHRSDGRTSRERQHERYCDEKVVHN